LSLLFFFIVGAPPLSTLFPYTTLFRSTLVGVSADRVALTMSTTDSIHVVLAGLHLEPEDEVVTTDAEHPGLALPLHASGARVVVAEVEQRPAGEALQAILDRVTERTRLIAVSHVLWTTGHVIP